MNEKKTTVPGYVLFLFGLAIGVAFTAWFYSGFIIPYYEYQIPGGHYLYSAPDGLYEVWVSSIEPGNVVWFPMCEHSAGQLHGDFKYLPGIELREATFYRVWLEDNVIVHAIEM